MQAAAKPRRDELDELTLRRAQRGDERAWRDLIDRYQRPVHALVWRLLAGRARFADDSGLPALEAGDTAILQAGAERLRHVVEGGGELLLVRVSPHHATDGSP